MKEQLFVCKNAAICNLNCNHNKPHSSYFGCEKIGEGLIDGDCLKNLPIEPCIPYIPPESKYTITIDSTTGKYTKNVYIREEEGLMASNYHLSIKPKNQDAPEEAKMIIIAKTRESALEGALKQLGWIVCKD